MDAIALGCLTALISRAVASPHAHFGPWPHRRRSPYLHSLFFDSSRQVGPGSRRSGHDPRCAGHLASIIAAATQTNWKAPRFLAPLSLIWVQRSYEVYLTHMFVVFALFALFVAVGMPFAAIARSFIAVTIIAALLGDLVARVYSEAVEPRHPCPLAQKPNQIRKSPTAKLRART